MSRFFFCFDFSVEGRTWRFRDRSRTGVFEFYVLARFIYLVVRGF